MESRIPLPTDNIYKFYALFGLLLFIFGIGASIAQTKLTNDFMARSFIGLETLKAIEKPSSVEAVRVALLERRMEIEKDDKKTIHWLLAFVIAVGMLLMIYGFHRWHTRIQPTQDDLLQLQLEKLRREVAVLPAVATAAPTSHVSAPQVIGKDISDISVPTQQT